MRPEVTTSKMRQSRRGFLGLGIAALSTTAFIGSGLTGAARAQSAADIGYMTPDEAHKAVLAGEIILIDIRRPDEWHQTNVAEGAIGLDMREESFVQSLLKLRQSNPDIPLALICRTGNRTGHVTTVLAKQGFTGLVDVNEGMAGGRNGPGWIKRGLPTYAGTLENVSEKTKVALR